MYLNLFHNGKKYIYETGNKLNIGHLKEISEGILKSNKNIMQIIYDNPSTYHKYINPNDKTYLRDLIPKGQKKAHFSIKLGTGNSASNIKLLKKSEIENGIEDLSKKDIFGNFAYMYNAQKKFNMMINYKFNELLLEIRELIRRINEVYEEIYKIFEQSNINYNQDKSKNNKLDVSNKMKQITEYEFHIIKFLEKEKSFYGKLNSIFKQCLSEQNGKIIVSNKILKEIYKNMFIDNNKFDLKDKNDYISNIIENPFKNKENKDTNTNKINLSLEDELFHDKIFKNKSKKFLHSLSSLNVKNNINDFSYNNFNKNNNSNFNTNDAIEKDNKNNKQNMKLSISNNKDSFNINKKQSKLMISTEIGQDGVQRGKIVLFSDEKKAKKEIDSKTNKEKKEKKNEETAIDKINNSKLNLIKNRLNFRNNKVFGFPSFKTNLDIKKNINIFSTEEDKKKLNELKINTQKNIEHKNNSINMNKELNEKNKDNIKESKNPSIAANENISDSTDYLNNNKNNKNISNNNLNKIENNDNNTNNKKEENNNDNKNDNINNNNENNTKDNNNIDTNNNINSNNEKVLNLNDDNDESEKNTKKKKKIKKERKKRRNSSEDNSSKTENESEKEKKKSEKKKNNMDDSKESEGSKKSSTKDLFDLHLLKNLSVDKDNPYKKNVKLYGNKKVKENELIRPEIPESDDSEEEKKKLAFIKKKKKNHIKNKYDFLI